MFTIVCFLLACRNCATTKKPLKYAFEGNTYYMNDSLIYRAIPFTIQNCSSKNTKKFLKHAKQQFYSLIKVHTTQLLACEDPICLVRRYVVCCWQLVYASCIFLNRFFVISTSALFIHFLHLITH